MEQRIKLVNEGSDSFFSYFVKGLILLDKYFTEERLSETDRKNMADAFETSAVLSFKDDIIKYYYLSLLIDGDKNKINEFKHTFKFVLNEYKFALIKYLNLYFTHEVQKFEELKNYEYFDSIDYLILYAVNKEYHIDIVKDKNYIWESIRQGRRSKALVNAALREKIDTGMLTEEFINLHAEAIIQKNDKTVLDFIAERGLLSSISERNVKLIENILLPKTENKFNKKLVEKYITYCLYSKYINVPFLEEIKEMQYKYLNESISLLLLWSELFKKHNSKSKGIEALAQRTLINGCHLSAVEVELLEKSHEPVFEVKKKNIYIIKISIPLKEVRFKIDISFENYKKSESFDYFDGFSNYYFLPEKPLKIRLYQYGKIIECKEEEFECSKLSSEAQEGGYQPFPMNFNIKENYEMQSDRFFLFLYTTSGEIHRRPENHMIGTFINNKELFSKSIYLHSLLKLQRCNSTLQDNLITLISNEILRIKFNPITLHEAIINEKDINKILELIYIARDSGIEPQIRTYIYVFNKSVKDNYINEAIGILCEEFVYKRAVINNDIYNLLQECYRNLDLNSEYSESCINILGLYTKKSIASNELVLRKYIKENNFDYRFYSAFTNIYEELGPKDEFIKECVNALIHSEKYYFDRRYFEIFKVVYENDFNNMALLQEIILKSIHYYVKIKDIYLKKIKDFYIDKRLLNDTNIIILIYLFHEGYNDVQDFIAGYCNIYYFDEEDKNNDRIVKKLDEVSLKRKRYIEENIKLFLSLYSRIENLAFRDYAGKYCIHNNIFYEDVLSDYLISRKMDSSKAGILLIDNLKEINLKKAAGYISVYTKYCMSNEDNLMLKNYLEGLSNVNSHEVIELLYQAGLDNKTMWDVSKMLLEKLINLGSYSGIEKLFSLFEKDFDRKDIQKLLLKYLKSIERVQAESIVFIDKLISTNSQINFGMEMKNVIFDILVNNGESCTEEQTMFVLKEINVNDKGYKKILKFVEGCPKSDKIGEQIYKLAVEIFESNPKLTKELLAAIKNCCEKARILLKKLNSKECTVLGRYYFVENTRKIKDIMLYEGNEATNGTKVQVLKIKENLMNAFENYAKGEGISIIEKFDNFFIIKDFINQIDIEKILDSFSNNEPEEFDVKKGIEQFMSLDEEKKLSVIDYLIQKDIFEKNIYDFMLEQKTAQIERVDYLLNYYTDEQYKAKNLLNLLKNTSIKEVQLNKRTKILLINFVRSLIKNKFESPEVTKKFIQGTNMLNGEEKESLSYLLACND